MAKKTKILVIVFSCLIIVISAFIIFINIPFKISFDLVGEYPIDESDLEYKDISLRAIYQSDIENGARFVKNQEFTDYMRAFDFSNGFLIFSSRKPIKTVTFKYKMYSKILYYIISANTLPTIIEYIFIDVELDDDSEATDNYYLYQISDKRVYKKTITRIW